MTTKELIQSLRACAATMDPIAECEFPQCSLQKEKDPMCIACLLHAAADKLESLMQK